MDMYCLLVIVTEKLTGTVVNVLRDHSSTYSSLKVRKSSIIIEVEGSDRTCLSCKIARPDIDP